MTNAVVLDDNTPEIYWCVTEANLFIVVACMPAMHSIFHKTMPKIFGCDRRERSDVSLAFGVISKPVEVEIQREDRSESDNQIVSRSVMPRSGLKN